MGSSAMILFGTLGFTAPKLIPSIKKSAEVERVVLFFDKNPKSHDAHRKVAEHCHDLGIPIESHELDAFDLIGDAVAIRKELQKHPRGTVVFNITGGTTILSSAALLACVLEGVRCVYLRQDTEEQIPLPLLTIPYHEYINDKQRLVLEAIRDHGGDVTQAEIGRTIKKSKPDVNHHVREFLRMGLIETRPNPEDARQKLIRLAPSTNLLLMGKSK
jgi:CRISPR locus-related DNA-binding protein